MGDVVTKQYRLSLAGRKPRIIPGKYKNKMSSCSCVQQVANSKPANSMVSCQKGPTRHAYAWQIGPFWQDTLAIKSVEAHSLASSVLTATDAPMQRHLQKHRWRQPLPLEKHREKQFPKLWNLSRHAALVQQLRPRHRTAHRKMWKMQRIVSQTTQPRRLPFFSAGVKIHHIISSSKNKVTTQRLIALYSR